MKRNGFRKIKYIKEKQVIFKNANGEQFHPINGIFADTLEYDDGGYLYLFVDEQMVFFTTHVKAVRFSNRLIKLDKTKEGGITAHRAYVTVDL